MPPHSSRPRRHLINGQSCPVRGPFILALGDARLPGRRAPHWADCASGSPSKLPGCWHAAAPWTLPRQHLVFFGFISSSGRQAPPARTLSQHRLDFPQTLALSTVYGGSHKPSPTGPACGLRKALEAAPATGGARAAAARRRLSSASLGEALSTSPTGKLGAGRGYPAVGAQGFVLFPCKPQPQLGTCLHTGRNGIFAHGQARRGDLLPHIPFN